MDCVIESVLEENESGPVIDALVRAPVPFPVRMPPSVVEPVPPTATPMVVDEVREVPLNQMGRPAEKEVLLVPPLLIARVPVHSGVKVKVEPELEMLRRRLVSEEVAKVRAPVCPVPYVCAMEDTPFCIEVVATQVGMPFERERM